MEGNLISRDALLEEIEDWHDQLNGETVLLDRCIQNVLSAVMDTINDMEPVDAVDVVRCKDCVHAGAFPNAYAARRFEGAMNCYLCRGDDGYGIANVSLVYPDDYCSDGVRRDGV